MLVQNIIEKFNERNDRSAWDKGVTIYALELCENLNESFEYTGETSKLLKDLLNGANTWSEYSWGGCSLIYNGDIAERLCCPSEFKKCREGERRPNSREEWLDVQARALFQACNRIKKIVKAYN